MFLPRGEMSMPHLSLPTVHIKPETKKGKQADCSNSELPSSFVKRLAFTIGE